MCHVLNSQWSIMCSGVCEVQVFNFLCSNVLKKILLCTMFYASYSK